MKITKTDKRIYHPNDSTPWMPFATYHHVAAGHKRCVGEAHADPTGSIALHRQREHTRRGVDGPPGLEVSAAACILRTAGENRAKRAAVASNNLTSQVDRSGVAGLRQEVHQARAGAGMLGIRRPAAVGRAVRPDEIQAALANDRVVGIARVELAREADGGGA